METPDLLSAALDESGIGEEEMANNHAQDSSANMSRFQIPPHLMNYLPPHMIQQMAQAMAQQMAQAMAQQMPFPQGGSGSKFPPGGGGPRGPGMDGAGKGSGSPYYMVPPFGFKAGNGSAPLYPMFRPPFDMKYGMGPGAMPAQFCSVTFGVLDEGMYPLI
ncbi:hypothetical protein HPB49_021471 [Dermacentor silvarum]|uniref:Uncharacterized protein n=1 Tax=Dermacentor silvarum TaxID=543639 RepID=A0ACB8D8E2_DERSI|nr:hypothetical protein HPB49_021471 [Dermacentor silvarum]